MAGSNFIISGIIALVVFLTFMLIVQKFSKKDNVAERLKRMADTEVPDAYNQNTEPLEPLYANRDYSPLAEFFNKLLEAIGNDTEAFRKKSQLRFYQAGIQSPDAPIYFLTYKRLGMAIFFLIGVKLFFAHEEGLMKMLYYIIGVCAFIAAFFGADLYIKNKREHRQQVLQRSFPDALDLLLVCVESGLALDGALSRVCKELGNAHPVITQELNRTRLELTLLNDRTKALTNLAERTDLLPFRSLVATLLQAERFGTSLTETLRVLSEDYRNTRLMKAEEKAGRLPVLITVPLIVLLIPALFIIILGPAIISTMATLKAM